MIKRLLLALAVLATQPVFAAGYSAVGGSGHSMVLDGDGRVWGWGYNKYGTVGDGSESSVVPYAQTTARRAAIENVVTLASGQGYGIAVKTDGTVWTWGYGYLGHGAYEGKTLPTQVQGLGNIKQSASGLYHTLVLNHGSRVFAWGNNSRGAVGDGTTSHRANPVAVDTLSDVQSLAASGHSLALKRDGTVWAWGENTYGQAGSVAGEHSALPQPVAGLVTVKQVAAGRNHSLALHEDGTVSAWGQGLALGNGTGKDSAVPVKIGNLSNVIAVAAGDGFSMVLKDDGTIWTFGLYEFSLSGNSMLSLVPRQVSGLSDIVSIGAGFFHALAIKRDGSIWTWGMNDVGQLGNGQSGNVVNTPVGVLREGAEGLALTPQSSFDASADRLFNWGETAYPTLFPVHALSQSGSGYYYRCYPGNRCLGEQGGEVFLYDSGSLTLVGKLAELLQTLALPAGY